MRAVLLILILAMLSILSVPTLVWTDEVIIERALRVKRSSLADSFLVPVQFARARIAWSSDRKCVLSDDPAQGRKRVLNYIVASFGIDGMDDEYAKNLLSIYVKSGCDINERDVTGLTPLHDAILFSQPSLVKFLLSIGSDKTIEAHLKNGGPADAIRFAEFLTAKQDTPEYREILKLLRQED